MANDLTCVRITDATFTGTGIVASGIGVVPLLNNSPYADALFNFATGNLAGRVVGCGLRVRYMGTELNRSGRSIALETPDHEDSAGNSIPTLLGYDKVTVKPNSADRTWHAVTWQPVSAVEMEYRSDGANPAYPGGRTNSPLVIAVSGVAGETWEAEAYVLFEAIGSNVRGKRTVTAEPALVDKVLGYANTVNTANIRNLAIKAGIGAGRYLAGRVMQDALPLMRTSRIEL